MSGSGQLDPARGFGRTMGIGRSPAVVVIDMVQGFTNPALPLGSEMDDPLAAARRLLDAARSGGIPVFFSTVYYEDDGVWGRKISTLGSIRANSLEAEIDPCLGRRPEEPVIAKKYPSVFFGTDFSSQLGALGIDTLLIAGCSTSGCVRATVIDALSNGLIPIVVKEAVADRSEPAHRQSLIDMQDKYADVISLEDGLGELGVSQKERPKPEQEN